MLEALFIAPRFLSPPPAIPNQGRSSSSMKVQEGGEAYDATLLVEEQDHDYEVQSDAQYMLRIRS
jgi:hypothetical protein